MVDQTEFKHITVTEGDDDVVIVAGAPRTEAVAEGAEEAPTSEEQPSQVRAEATAMPSKSPKAASETAQQPERDAYQQTTLDDIEQSKMPLTQKIVVAVAVIAVLAFIIWYCIF